MDYTFNKFDRVKPSPLYRQQFPKAKVEGGSIERGGDKIVTVRWDRKRGVEELHVDYIIATGENWPVPSQFHGKRSQIYHEAAENRKVLRAAVMSLRADQVTFKLASRIASAMNGELRSEREILIAELAAFGFILPFPKRFINTRYDENQL